MSKAGAEESAQVVRVREPQPGPSRRERIRQPAFWVLLLGAEAAWLGVLVYLVVLFL